MKNDIIIIDADRVVNVSRKLIEQEVSVDLVMGNNLIQTFYTSTKQNVRTKEDATVVFYKNLFLKSKSKNPLISRGNISNKAIPKSYFENETSSLSIIDLLKTVCVLSNYSTLKSIHKKDSQYGVQNTLKELFTNSETAILVSKKNIIIEANLTSKELQEKVNEEIQNIAKILLKRKCELESLTYTGFFEDLIETIKDKSMFGIPRIADFKVLGSGFIKETIDAISYFSEYEKIMDFDYYVTERFLRTSGMNKQHFENLIKLYLENRNIQSKLLLKTDEDLINLVSKKTRQVLLALKEIGFSNTACAEKAMTFHSTIFKTTRDMEGDFSILKDGKPVIYISKKMDYEKEKDKRLYIRVNTSELFRQFKIKEIKTMIENKTILLHLNDNIEQVFNEKKDSDYFEGLLFKKDVCRLIPEVSLITDGKVRDLEKDKLDINKIVVFANQEDYKILPKTEIVNAIESYEIEEKIVKIGSVFVDKRTYTFYTVKAIFKDRIRLENIYPLNGEIGIEKEKDWYLPISNRFVKLA